MKEMYIYLYRSDGVAYKEQDLSNDKSLINDIDTLNVSEVTGFPDDDNISIGNAIQLTKEEYEYIYIINLERL